jgi:hypothetical protein
LEKDKDAKKKRNEQQQQNQQSPPSTPIPSNAYESSSLMDSLPQMNKNLPNSSTSGSLSGVANGGAKKVNVEVIMKSNPFRVGNLTHFLCSCFTTLLILLNT